MKGRNPRIASFFVALIFVLAVNDALAQTPVVTMDTLQQIKDHHNAVADLKATVYELNPSSLKNDKGQEVYLVPKGDGTFWAFNRGPQADVTIRLRENVVVMPEEGGMVSFLDLEFGSFAIEGPADVSEDSLPEFSGFSRESGGGGFLNMFGTGDKLTLSNLRYKDTHADGSGGQGGVLNLRGGITLLNGVWFDHSTAQGNGGAISATGSATVTVHDSVFLDNDSGNFGGGVYFAGDEVTIARSVFAGNTAEQRGGNLDIHGGSRIRIKGNFGFDGVGSMIGDGFYFDPDDDTEFTIMNNVFLGASNCNTLSLNYGPLGDVSYNMVDNSGSIFSSSTFLGSGGMSYGNLFSSRNFYCPRLGDGMTQSDYNIDAGGSGCASKYMMDLSLDGLSTEISTSKLKLSLDDRYMLFDIVRSDLGKWGDHEMLLDRVPAYVWASIPFSSQESKSASSKTKAEQPGVTDNCPLTDSVGLARPQDGDGDGTPACDAGPLEKQNGPDIGFGQSGAFYDVNRNGEGIFVQMLDAKSAVVYVFSFTPTGEQMWLLGVGEVMGNSISFTELLQPSGPVFGPGYDPTQVIFNTWGRMSVHWPTCVAPQNKPGVMTFRSRDEAYGKIRVSSGRLTAPIACAGAEQHEKAGWSGSYYLPEENGHGVVVEVLPDGTVVMIWYLYDESGKQRWVLGTGKLVGNKAEIAELRMPAGALWGDAFDPADVVDQIWGSAILTFNSCSKMVVDYTGIQGARSLVMSRLTTLAGGGCTP